MNESSAKIPGNPTPAPASSRLQSLAAHAASRAQGRPLPPVHLWNPDFCGDIDMVIRRDGSWHYMGTPIARPAMVKLFSTILRHDNDGRYYLVTPVEKVGIRVEDAPFTAVEMMADGKGRDQVISFRTNVDDEVTVDAAHPIEVRHHPETGEPSPYVLVRAGLRARLSRPVFYQLVDLAEVQPDCTVGIWSDGVFFSLGSIKEE